VWGKLERPEACGEANLGGSTGKRDGTGICRKRAGAAKMVGKQEGVRGPGFLKRVRGLAFPPFVLNRERG